VHDAFLFERKDERRDEQESSSRQQAMPGRRMPYGMPDYRMSGHATRTPHAPHTGALRGLPMPAQADEQVQVNRSPQGNPKQMSIHSSERALKWRNDKSSRYKIPGKYISIPHAPTCV
jgi:hypothetical protein